MRIPPWSRVITLLLPLVSCSRSGGTSLGRRAFRSEIVCSWNRPQSSLVRDTIYLDGGLLVWQVTAEDGKISNDAKARHRLYSLELTHPFALSDGQKAITNASKPDGNMGTDFKNGFMLANDYQFIIYGGYMDFVDKDPAIGQSWALARYLFQNGNTPLERPSWQTLGLSGVTRYIAAGGSVDVPSENKSFVFSGVTGEDWGEFYTTETAADDQRATWNSTNLISVDMTTMTREKWSNSTFPSSIPARKNAEVVWIPVGAQGTLVVIGGALNRDIVRYRLDVTPEQTTMGARFVQEVHLYDIANDKWYTQSTSGDIPRATSEFCTVVAPSQDGKSFQIYAYGGWEDFTSNPTKASTSANVYVLSLPSFVWTKVYDGADANHGRKGHRCHRVAGNLMMVVGGAQAADSSNCIGGGLVRLFNLNTLAWEENYSPSMHEDYEIPSVVYSATGGSATGGTTVRPSWNDSSISSLFTISYTKTVKNWWPYSSVPTTSSSGTIIPRPTNRNQSDSNDSSGMPSYVPPLLGAILGLLLLITALCGALFYLRRRQQERRSLQTDSAASEVRRKHQTWSWLLGTSDEKRDWAAYQQPTGMPDQDVREHGGPAVGPMMGPMGPMGAVGALGGVAAVGAVREEPVEAGSRQVHEMPGRAVAHELSGEGVRRVTISDTVTEITGGERMAGAAAQSPTNMSPTSTSPTQPPSDRAYLLQSRSTSTSSSSNTYPPAPNPYPYRD